MSHIQTKIKNNAKFLVLFSSFLLLLLVIKLACVFYLPNPIEIQPVHAASFTVDDTGDASDASAGDGNCATAGAVCTLRAAIEEVNALGGENTISIGSIGTTTPGSSLPSITSATTTMSGPGSDGFVIDGTSAGSDTYGITLSATNIILSGVTIKNFGRSGIWVSTSGGCASSTITNMRLLTNTWNGVEIHANNTTEPSRNITFTNNVAIGNLKHGIDNTNAKGATISNNTSMSNAWQGISIATASSTQIINNTVNSNGQGGISLTTSTSTTINGNTVTSNTGMGIALATFSDYNTVSDNILDSNSAGVMLQSYADNNTITGNTITNSNTYSGIYIQLFSNNSVVSGNTISGSASSYPCIILAGPENTQVISNTLSNCNSDGVRLGQHAAWGNGTVNTISGNTITSVGRHGIYVGETGSPYDVTIASNTISQSIQDGIYIKNTASTTISSNTIYSNNQDGIYITDSGHTIVSSNTIYSNSSSPTYQATMNLFNYDGSNYGSSSGAGSSVFYLIDNTSTEVSFNDTTITGLDGTQDLYFYLLSDDPDGDDNTYTYYSNKSYAGFLSWCQSNIAATCQVNAYSTEPIWQANGAGIAYTWNEDVVPDGATHIDTYYYSSILAVNYDGDDYTDEPFGFGAPTIFILEGLGSSFNFLVQAAGYNYAYGLSGTENLDLYLVGDSSIGSSTWIAASFSPYGDTAAEIVTLMLGSPDARDVCIERDVFVANGEGEDYTFKPLDEWTGCTGATMISGYDNPTTLTAVGNNTPSLAASFAYSAINLASATSTTMTSNTIYDNGNGITFSGSSDGNTVDGGSIATSLGYDIQHSASGDNTLDNLSFDSDSTNVTAGQVDVYYDTRGYVKDSGGSPISGAVCSVAPQAGGSSTSLGTTDATGYTSYTAVNAFDIDSTGIINGNSHIMTATKNAANYTSSATAIDSINKTISISSAPLSNIGGLGSAGISSGQTTPTTEGDTTDTEEGTEGEDTTQDDADTNTEEGTDTSEGDESTEGEGTDNNQGTSNNNNPSGTSSTKGLSTTITHSPEETKLIKFEDKSTVYIVNEKNKTLEPIFSESVFTDRGFSWDQIENTSSENYQNYQTGNPLFYQNGVLVKSPYDSSVYKLENNTKRPITNANIFTRLGYMWNQIKTVAQDILDMLPVGKGIK